MQIKSMDDVEELKGLIAKGQTSQICPIFSVSSVEGAGVQEIRKFLSLLPKPQVNQQANDMIETNDTEINTKFIVDSRFFCKGVGLILGGTVLRGSIKIDQQMMFGPDRNGNFRPVAIKGIHENRVPI